jgi:hypothetical protein
VPFVAHSHTPHDYLCTLRARRRRRPRNTRCQAARYGLTWTGLSPKRFGSYVAQIVADCTDSWVEPKPAWRPRKEAYLSLLPKKAPTSLLVSLADKVDNAEAILHDYRNIGDELWSRFTGGRDGTIWYYRKLILVWKSQHCIARAGANMR